MALNERLLEVVAEECRRCIIKREHGILAGDLSNLVTSYEALRNPEKFRVQIMLCKMPSISVVVTGWRKAFRFYPASMAPDDAFNYAASAAERFIAPGMPALPIVHASAFLTQDS